MNFQKLRKTVKPLLHALFGGAVALALSAFFEQCLKNGVPFWSTVLGCPFPHHGYVAFALLIAAYATVTLTYEVELHG